MPTEKTVLLYTFDELSDKAKEKARDWFRSCRDTDDLDSVTEDFATICIKLGISLQQKPVRLMSGKTRYDPALWYSLGYCQGDFAAFDGYYRYVKGAAKALSDYAPQDLELQRIARTLTEVQKRNFYRLTSRIKYHSYYGLQVDTERDGVCYCDADGDIVQEAMRDLARWFYNALRAEDEYQGSDEVVDANITCNGYTFTADGTRDD